MAEKFKNFSKDFKEKSPQIEIRLGTTGLLSTGFLALNRESMHEYKSDIPFVYFNKAEKGLGVSDSVTFSALAVLFGLGTIHGVWVSRRNRAKNSKNAL